MTDVLFKLGMKKSRSHLLQEHRRLVWLPVLSLIHVRLLKFRGCWFVNTPSLGKQFFFHWKPVLFVQWNPIVNFKNMVVRCLFWLVFLEIKMFDVIFGWFCCVDATNLCGQHVMGTIWHVKNSTWGWLVIHTASTKTHLRYTQENQLSLPFVLVQN